jgi:predicted transcriptional regulator
MPFEGFLRNPKRIHVQIEEEAYQKLTELATQEATPVSFIIRQAIKEFIETKQPRKEEKEK